MSLTRVCFYKIAYTLTDELSVDYMCSTNWDKFGYMLHAHVESPGARIVGHVELSLPAGGSVG